MRDVGIKFKADMSEVDAVPSKMKVAMDGVSGALQLNIAGKIASGMGELVKQTVGAAQNIEMLKLSFEALTGSAGAAEEVMSGLVAFAASTPFQLGELSEAAKQILLAGVSTRELQGELRNLGNVAAVSGKPLIEVAGIYSKIGATGKVGAEELLQLAQANVPIYEALAKTLGVAQDEVKGLVSKGRVGFAEIREALASVAGEGGKFGGAMNRMAATGAGLLSTLKDGWAALAVTIGAPINDALKPVLKVAISLLDWVNEKAKDSAGVIPAVLGGIGGVVVLAGLRAAVSSVRNLALALSAAADNAREAGNEGAVAAAKIASAARVATVAQASVGGAVASRFNSSADAKVVRTSFSMGKLSKGGTTVLPSYSGAGAGAAASTLPVTPVFDMSKRVSASTGKLAGATDHVGASVGKLGGLVGGLVGGLAAIFSPLNLAIVGATAVVAQFAAGAAKQDEFFAYAEGLDGVTEAAKRMTIAVNGGLKGGLTSDDERMAKMEENRKKAKDIQKEYDDFLDPKGVSGFFQSTWQKASAVIVGDDGITKEQAEACAKTQEALKALGAEYIALSNCNEERMASTRKANAAAAAEARAEQDAANAIRSKVEALKGLKAGYEKALKAANEGVVDGDSGLARLDRLGEERDALLAGKSRNYWGEHAEDLSSSHSDENKAEAAQIYENLTRVVEIEKAILEERNKQREAGDELNKQYALEVTAIEAELVGHQAVADSIRDRIAVEELAAKYREAGLEAYAAQSRAEGVINAKRRLELAKEQQEAAKLRKEKLADLAQERAGLLTRELGAEGGFSSDVMGIVERMDGLMEKYGAAGMKSGDAMRMALREGGLAAAERMKGAMLAGAVSSTRAIGGGGRYEQTKPLTIAGMEKQVKELVAIRDGIKELKGVGGL